MLITFEAVRLDNGELISSTCLIQKYICEDLKVLLGINGRWYYVKPETLRLVSMSYKLMRDC
jgi:hypothetical protein